MAKKEFQKKFMHPTRRKLVDMVLTGEYETNPTVGYTGNKVEKDRKVGETWEDKNGSIWEKTNYGKIKKSRLTDTMSEVREYLKKLGTCKSKDCSKKKKYGPTDKKLIRKTGFCSSCLAQKEWEIKKDGLWEEYSKYRMYSNMASHGTDLLEQLNNALDDVKDYYEFVNEDGSIEKWESPKPAEQIKKDILEDIEKGKKELQEVIEKRNEAYEKLKDKNYEIVEEIRS